MATKVWWQELEKELRDLAPDPVAAGEKMAVKLFEAGSRRVCHQQGLKLLNAAREMCLSRRVCEVQRVLARDERGLIQKTSRSKEIWPNDNYTFTAAASYYSTLNAIAFALLGQVQSARREQTKGRQTAATQIGKQPKPSTGLPNKLSFRGDTEAYYPRMQD